MRTEVILDKGSGHQNEDTLVLSKNLFGVFDGATSLDRSRFGNNRTGGMMASLAAKSVFAKNHYPLVKLAGDANQAIYRRMQRHGVNLSKKEDLWSTSAAVIRLKGGMVEWVQTGDCCIIMIYKDNTFKVLVEQDDHDYETLIMWKQEAQKGKAGIGDILMNQIRKVRAGMNIHYGVLNGEKEAELFLHQGTESLEGVKEILLFTDGLSIPRKQPEKSKSFKELVRLYLTLGLDGLKKRIRQMEKEDPHCIRYPRFKCHDDIAAIALQDM